MLHTCTHTQICLPCALHSNDALLCIAILFNKTCGHIQEASRLWAHHAGLLRARNSYVRCLFFVLCDACYYNSYYNSATLSSNASYVYPGEGSRDGTYVYNVLPGESSSDGTHAGYDVPPGGSSDGTYSGYHTMPPLSISTMTSSTASESES